MIDPPHTAPFGTEELSAFPEPGSGSAAVAQLPDNRTLRAQRWNAVLPKAYLVLLPLALAWVVVFPQVAPLYYVSLALVVLLTIVLAISWNIISGYTGYISFGHAGFFGIGSYIGALLIVHNLAAWWLAAILAGFGTALIALPMGVLTLRLRGPYFAITMFGFSELARIIVSSWDSLTGGGAGVYLPLLEDRTSNFYAMGILAVVAILVAYLIATSGLGLKLMCIREDEVAAQTLGVNTTWYKIGAFVLSAFFPGVAGAVYARQIGYIDPITVFGVIWSIRAVATTMFGGQGTIIGPILGGIILTLVSEWAWAENPFAYQVVFGGLVVLVVLFMPGGVMRLLELRGWIPRTRQL
jgi:branched-chain amino acid transport system permease protein